MRQPKKTKQTRESRSRARSQKKTQSSHIHDRRDDNVFILWMCSTCTRARLQPADTICAEPNVWYIHGSGKKREETIMLCAIFGTHYLFIKNVKKINEEKKKKKRQIQIFRSNNYFFVAVVCVRRHTHTCRRRWLIDFTCDSILLTVFLSSRFLIRSLCSGGHNLLCACFWVLPFRMQRTISPKRQEKERNIRIRMYINHINLFREKKNSIRIWTDKSQNREQSLSQSFYDYHFDYSPFRWYVSSKCHRLNWTACVWVKPQRGDEKTTQRELHWP